jgi:hypothetical protein
MHAVSTAPAVATYTINRDWILLSHNDTATPWVGECLDRSIWDVYPDAEPFLRPMLEHAWATGHTTGMIVFHGVLFEFTASTYLDAMIVTYEEIDHLDVTSLQTIVESLTRMIDVLEQPTLAPPALSLHVVPA